ncbi:MAG: ATP-dependent DNA helicase [Clostridia bacterium]|nr:ATP-dependent DNA helicase [Clostridia bacterium]
MKFERKERRLLASPEDAVAFALPKYAMWEEAPPARLGREEEKKETFCLEFPLGEGICAIEGTVSVETDACALSFSTEEDPRELSKDALAFVRGVGFLCLYGVGELAHSFTVTLQNMATGVVHSFKETPKKQDLSRFFDKIRLCFSADINGEAERLSKRYPSFLSVAFPYAEAREGQKDMMSAVYTAVKQGETLFAVAPTGTGKTMAVLFPTLRALGGGYAEKLFYLTPKTTSAQAAVDACRLLREKGADLRAVRLLAKERLCEGRRTKGTCFGCERFRGGKAKLSEAVRDLRLARLSVVTAKELTETAARFGVCPHALAVAYASYADVVIGDYNYLFDFSIAPASLFARERKYAFLVDEAHNLPDRAREMYSGGFTSESMAALVSLFEESDRLTERTREAEALFLRTVDAMLAGEVREDAEGTTVGFATQSRFPEAFERHLLALLEALQKETRQRTGEEDALGRARREAVSGLAETLRRLEAYDAHFVTYATREGEKRELRFFCLDPSEPVSRALDKGSAAVFFSATLEPLDYYRSVLCGKRHTVKIEVPSPFDSGALCIGVMDKISVRAQAREETLPEIARVIVTAMKPKRGNYMVFCPSYDYMERVAAAFRALTPKTPIAVQKRQMTLAERQAFLDAFKPAPTGYFVGFCVSGGVFSEGIDLVGDRLIGTVILGTGLPGVSAERELICSYYQDKYEEGKEYAYLYPGLNRVMQSAGRVIRSEDDRGIAVLVDDRLRDPAYRKMFPAGWRHLKYAGDRASLSALLTGFWASVEKEKDNGR